MNNGENMIPLNNSQTLFMHLIMIVDNLMKNKSSLLILVAVLILGAQGQWTTVINGVFRSPNPADAYTFLAGRDYTF